MLRRLVLLMGLGLLGGCSQKAPDVPGAKPPFQENLAFLKDLRNQFPPLFSLDMVQQMIQKGNLKEASTYINSALKMSVHNFALHLLNGFVYEEMARRGMEGVSPELALIAYRSAYGLEPNHWLTAYLYGNFELHRKNYDQAQKLLAEAVVRRPQDPTLCYALAHASYYRGDLPVALVNIKRALQCGGHSNRFIQRAAVMIFSASGQFDRAQQALKAHRTCAGSTAQEQDMLTQRMADWRRVHAQARLKKVAYDDDDDEEESSGGSKSPSAQTGKDNPAVPRLSEIPTVVLSLYVVDTLAGNITQKGNNILPLLNVTLNGGAKFDANSARGLPKEGQNWSGSESRVYNGSASLEQLNYVARLANTGETMIQYTARPEISTLVGKEAIFLESDSVSGTPPGGSSVRVDAGIKIVCVVENIDEDGEMTINLEVTGSSFGGRPNLSTGLVSQLIQLVKSKVTTKVKAYPGQTVLVAGVRSDRRNVNDRGVPLLRDLPLIQYFTSGVETSSQRRSVLYMIVPKLGGSAQFACGKKGSLSRPSAAAKTLNAGGIQILGEYSALYYILRYLETSPMFAQFRSGDLVPPFWGYGDEPLPSQLQKFKSFLYF